MGLLTKLKSLLGFEDDRSQVRRSDSGVTIERDPDESAAPDAETESAVKGVDAGGEESTGSGIDRETGTTAADATGAESGGADAGEADAGEADAGESTTTPEGIEEAESAASDAGAVDSDAGTAESGTEPATDEAAEPDQGGTADPAESAVASDDIGTGEPDDAETAEAGTEATESAEAGTEAETGDATDEADGTEAETDDVESEFADAAAEAAGAGEPLEDVKGIGPAYAERLRDAGVEDVGDLAGADAERLAEETDLSAKRISRWIERAGAR